MQSHLNTVRQAITPLSYNGHVITDKGDMLSLTDMWRADGGDLARAPAEWLRSADAKRFIDFVADTLNMGISHDDLIKVVRGGKSPGTWANWQIAFAYAKYLNPAFHAWCNTQVRAVMEGKANGALSSETIEQIERSFGIIRQMNHKVTCIEKSNADLRADVARLQSQVHEASQGLRRAGVTARQVWEQFSLPALKCGTLWLGNRLIKMGAGMEFGQRADIGGKAVRLFDPDKAKHCMENGLLNTARGYVSERQGQGRLHLVHRE